MFKKLETTALMVKNEIESNAKGFFKRGGRASGSQTGEYILIAAIIIIGLAAIIIAFKDKIAGLFQQTSATM